MADSEAARKRVDNNRSTTQKRRKSKKNEPGIFGSVLHYLAQEAHSFVTNLSGVTEDQEDNSGEDSEEESYSEEEVDKTEVWPSASSSPLIEPQAKSQSKANEVNQGPTYDYHNDLPQSCGAGPSRLNFRPAPPQTKSIRLAPSTRLRQALMPGSLFPRSPSPDGSVSSMKHVHFTPPVPKKSKSAASLRPRPRPEDVPLPRSRSASPSPPEETRKRERRAGLSERRKRDAHWVSDASQVQSDKIMSPPEESLTEVLTSYSSRTHISSVRHGTSPQGTISSRRRDIRNAPPVPDLRRSHSPDGINLRPLSTIVTSSEEPPNIPSCKGKERAIGEDSYDQTDGSNLSEDKIRIQLLEAEVERLRAELAARNRSIERRISNESLRPPPPPPPPPPMPSLNTRMPTTANTDVSYSEARANLRHKKPPVEKPIVPLGKPTVPPAHMQAFLSELKTVKLRKTNSTAVPASERSFHASRAADTSMLANRTWSAGDGTLLSSRKRQLEDLHRSEPPLAKRRLADGVDESYSLRRSKNHPLDLDQLQHQHASTGIRASVDVPPSLTTPSLSSEEREMPETPRSPSPNHDQVIDNHPGPSRPLINKSIGKGNSVFEHTRRVPTSPLNSINTPRKPKPPGRHRASARPQAYFPTKSEGGGEDPLLLIGDTHQTHHYNTRRLSRNLEREMLDADEHTTEDQEESGTLVGVGSKDSRGGFLARGGAGGDPVFLGEGYVRGFDQSGSQAKSHKVRQR